MRYSAGDIVWVDVFGMDVIGRIFSTSGNYATFEYLQYGYPDEWKERNVNFIRRKATIDDVFQYSKQIMEEIEI